MNLTCGLPLGAQVEHRGEYYRVRGFYLKGKLTPCFILVNNTTSMIVTAPMNCCRLIEEWKDRGR